LLDIASPKQPLVHKLKVVCLSGAWSGCTIATRQMCFACMPDVHLPHAARAQVRTQWADAARAHTGAHSGRMRTQWADAARAQVRTQWAHAARAQVRTQWAHAAHAQVRTQWAWRRRMAYSLLVFGVLSSVASTHAILGAVREENTVVQLAQQLAAHEAVVQDTARCA